MKKESLEEYLYSRLSTTSAKAYMFTLMHFLVIFPTAPKAKHREVVAYFGELHRRYSNHGTINRIICQIKKYYDYLIDTGQRNDHPCKQFKLKGRPKAYAMQKVFEPFTVSELQLLLHREERFADLALRNKAVMSLLIFQGLTLSEIVRLRVKDVLLDECKVRILGSSKLSGRSLPIDSTQMLVFDRYLRETRKKLNQTNSDKFILSSRGTPISTDDINYLVETFKPLFQGRNLNAKSIRASIIYNMLNIQNLPLQEVQDFAGHKQVKTTLEYRRPNLEKQKAMLREFHPFGRMFAQK
jgi:integrase/recombinase XerD